jgi:hypothetical protein
MKPTTIETLNRVSGYRAARIHELYVEKVERKGRTRAELDEVVRWLTGYSQAELDAVLAEETDLGTFFSEAPAMNPDRDLITGVICGVRVEEIEEPFMQEVRRLDKVVDELAKGRAMEKILRSR